MDAMDGAGIEGQVKADARPIPNTGGLGIVTALLLAATGMASSFDLGDAAAMLDAGFAWPVIAALLVVHATGLLDDRRPLPWLPKLAVMLLVPAAAAWLTDTRLLTALDPHVGGAWLSIALTALWFATVMNAVNFMDNMDGLAGGTALVVAAALAGVAGIQGQWGVAVGAALLAGACAGFLPHNYPRARVFMGDGGSLVLGFALAYLTTRLTYIEAESARWDRLAVPLILLAVPLYDMLSVVLIRLAQGKSPFVGDLQHLSHRFERRGLSRPLAVASIWTLAAVLGVGGIVMAEASPRQAVLVTVQAMLALALLAAIERWMHTEATP
ncbi:MAG: MraY family glycosyltransferase [Planctomycetota bacterium]